MYANYIMIYVLHGISEYACSLKNWPRPGADALVERWTLRVLRAEAAKALPRSEGAGPRDKLQSPRAGPTPRPRPRPGVPFLAAREPPRVRWGLGDRFGDR